MPDWDYFPLFLERDVGADDMMRDFQDLGRKGWELVAVAPYDDVSALVAFFKRPLGHGERAEPFVD